MKKLKILVIFDSPVPPPADQDYTELFKQEDWYTEAAVVETLQMNGHSVSTMGIYDNIRPLIAAIDENRPDIVFNLTEVFNNKAHLDKNIPALLETLGVPYTGCSAVAMAICNNKALSKKILSYHRVKVPRFHTFRPGRRVWVPRALTFPMVIKPLREEASTGISQNSYVANEEQFKERILYIHEKMKMAVIAEEYIEGRELYIGLLGARRIWAFPVREMTFDNVPAEDPKMATYTAKWDEEYRKKWGIRSVFPEDIPEDTHAKLLRTCKRAYKSLNIDGYARFDCRLTRNNDLYILEGNANPELAMGDEFAESAKKAGFTYDKLLHKMIQLGLDRRS